MVTQAPKVSAMLAAIAFALSCIGLIIFVWVDFKGSVPFAPQGYRVRALFSESGLLVPGADVRISGVDIGRVTGVAPRGVNSLVTMDIDRRYAPIPADARAILRTKTLLGEAYVELSPGTGSGRKLRDGGEIPLSQVAPTQPLDRIVNAFTRPTQQHLQALLNGTGAALAGRGEALNDAFGNSGPAVTELAAIVGVLNQQQRALQTLINTGATALGTLSARRADLQTIVDAGDRVFAATAARNAQLTATVDRLPPFLRALRTTLGDLNVSVAIARPSVHEIAVDAPLLLPALRDLNRLTGPTLTLLRQGPGVLRSARAALPAVTRFAREFRPLVDGLVPVAQQVIPEIDLLPEWVREVEAGMTNVAATLQGSFTANTPSGAARYVRAMVTIGSDSLFGQTHRSPAERSNTYISPGELTNIAHGLLAMNCDNTGNTAQFPVADGNVPCRLQKRYPWGHGLPPSYFPRVLARRR
jgi:virulence factor Mce-like protein